jgi:hypothetical protein
VRAEDVLDFMRELDRSAGPDDTIMDVMLREGIAYDEIDRFLCLGGFRVEGKLSGGEGPEDEAGALLYLHGRLWLDGFLVGRRMMLHQMLQPWSPRPAPPGDDDRPSS